MNTARLTWMLSRPGRAGLGLSLLPMIAFAVVTTLLLAVIGGAQTFWTQHPHDPDAFLYQFLAVVALALLVVPLLGLGGAAARLAARRRDDRLATLRLLGATTSTVGAMAVLEAGALALAGAVVGGLLSLALAPLIGLIPFRGAPLGTVDVLVAPLAVIGIIAVVVLIAIVSAVLGLRRVVLSPLGVRMRTDPPKLGWISALVGLAFVAVATTAVSVIGSSPGLGIMIAIAGGAFGGTIAVLNLIGPAVIGLVARRRARTAPTAAKLLAARGILESPRDAWRQVSGAAMTSFMAVFTGVGVGLLSWVGSGNATTADVQLLTDIRTGVIVTIAGSFLMIACSVGVTQAASVLDRAELSRSLARLGAPLGIVDGARRGTVLVPLLITTVGSALCAAIVMLPLTGMSLLLQPMSLVTIAIAIAVGIGLVLAGVLVTRPLLARTMAEPA